MRFEGLTVEDFLSKDYRTEPILPDSVLDKEGLLLIAGKTGVGKSYLMQQLLVELSAGQDWLDRWSVTRPYKTWMIQAEIGRGRFQDRTRRLSDLYNFDPSFHRVDTVVGIKLNKKQYLDELQECVENWGIEVIGIDPVRPFYAGNENDSEAVGDFYDGLRKVCYETGCSFIVNHHERKGMSGESNESDSETRGSGVWTDRVDTVLRITGRTTRHLKFQKRRNSETQDQPSYPLRMINGVFSIEEGGGLTVGTKDVLSVLNGRTVGVGELEEQVAKHLGLSTRTVRKRVDMMEEEGLIEKIPDPDSGLRKLVRMVNYTSD